MYSELQLFRTKKVIRQLAKERGVDEMKLRIEMEQAIEAGLNNSDSVVKAAWTATPFSGRKPSLEEFILWCSEQN